MWFVTARRHEQELAAAKKEIAALRRRVLDTQERHDEVARAHNRLAKRLSEADAANRRLYDRNLELGRRVSVLAESDLEYAAHLERRKTSLEKAGHRILAAWRREQKRADHLQQRLDDAVGLSTTIVDSGRWQPGYKPAPKPEVAS
jgi:chromosome segregation ATPase